MKKIVVTGAKGQLVSDLIAELSFGPHCDYEIFAFTREELDVTDVEKVSYTFYDIDPDVWIQGASYHVVEEINNNPQLAADINVACLHTISNLCNEYKTTLINFSTNYVFDGARMPPEGFRTLEHYNENDTPNPVNLYGILKYAGERIVSTTCERYYNIRVSGLFSQQGSRAKDGRCFPSIILNELDESNRADVVADQVVNLTYTPTAAKWIEKMIRKESKNVYGLYHLVNRGDVTWFEAAQELASLIGQFEDVYPIDSDDFYTNLQRPLCTPLNPTKLEDTFQDNRDDTIPYLREDLKRYLIKIGRLV
jgi:dTDP-4-dehydrorhamnose reductase